MESHLSRTQLHIIWGAAKWSIQEISLEFITNNYVRDLFNPDLYQEATGYFLYWVTSYSELKAGREGKKEHNLPWTGMREAEQDKKTAAR